MTDPTSLPNFPPPPEEHPLRGRVLDALQDLKLQPDLDRDGDVSFKAQGQQLFVRSLEGGKVDIMRVFGQWQVAPTVPDDMLTRLNGCNDITLGVNLVKAGIANGNLVLTVEQIVTKSENPRPKVQVAVGLLLQAVQLWHKNVLIKSGVVQPPETEGGTRPDPGPWLSEGPRRASTQDTTSQDALQDTPQDHPEPTEDDRPAPQDRRDEPPSSDGPDSRAGRDGDQP